MTNSGCRWALPDVRTAGIVAPAHGRIFGPSIASSGASPMTAGARPTSRAGLRARRSFRAIDDVARRRSQ